MCRGMQEEEEEAEDEFIDQLKVQFIVNTQNICMSHTFLFHNIGQKYFLVPLRCRVLDSTYVILTMPIYIISSNE